MSNAMTQPKTEHYYRWLKSNNFFGMIVHPTTKKQTGHKKLYQPGNVDKDNILKIFEKAIDLNLALGSIMIINL